MKKMIIEWKKPIIRSATFDEITKYIKAMARSGDGTACFTGGEITPPSCTACSGSGECSCVMGCNPSALYFSCTDFFISGRSGNAGTR